MFATEPSTTSFFKLFSKVVVIGGGGGEYTSPVHNSTLHLPLEEGVLAQR